MRLQNDYKSLTDRIEAGLEVHFASSASNGSIPSSARLTEIPSSSEAENTANIVFAKVNSVSPGSPAEEAGLKQGDLIRQFGTIDNANNEKLRKVAEVVAQNEQVSIMVHFKKRIGLTRTEGYKSRRFSIHRRNRRNARYIFEFEPAK